MAKTIRELQSSLPWTTHYHRDFRASPMTHKEFQHALLHIHKAGGKLAALVNDAEHSGVEWSDPEIREQVGKYTADLVVCALRMANTCPEGVIDLQDAVEARISDKNPPNGSTGESYNEGVLDAKSIRARRILDELIELSEASATLSWPSMDVINAFAKKELQALTEIVADQASSSLKIPSFPIPAKVLLGRKQWALLRVTGNEHRHIVGLKPEFVPADDKVEVV